MEKYEKIINEQQQEISRLKSELAGLFSFFSEMESGIASQDILEFTSSNIYFIELLEQFVSSGPHNSKLSVAKEMGIAQGRLYDLINGKRALTSDHLDAIKKALKLDEVSFTTLKDLADQDRNRKKEFKKIILDRVTKQTSPERSRLTKIKKEERKFINSWLHYSILSLFEMDGFIGTREWIANKVETDLDEVNSVIDSLIEMGHITEENGELVYTFVESSMSYATPEDNKSNFQKLTMGQINKAVEVYNKLNIPFENQEKAGYGGYFLVGDKSRVQKANRMMDEAVIKIARYLSEGKKDQLLSLSFQIAPIGE